MFRQDASKYTDEQVDHMRRVVSYCARHLAQEEKMKDTKTEEELEKTKSTKSLKNWVSSSALSQVRWMLIEVVL